MGLTSQKIKHTPTRNQFLLTQSYDFELLSTRDNVQFISEQCSGISVSSLPSWLHLSCMIFLCGLLGMVFNFKNFIVTVMCIEVSYVGAVSSFVFYGAAARNAGSAINGLLVLIFGACESAVGLGLLVAAYRFGHKIDFLSFMLIGG